MKLPEWDNKFQRWDRYKRFHIGVDANLRATDNWCYPSFIMFESGELICTHNRPRPENRYRYNLLNVSLVATRDSNCPTLYTNDDEPIPKAWLNVEGQRYLLVDHDTRRVVEIGDRDCDAIKGMPAFETRATAYFPAAYKNPVGAPVQVRPPLRVTLTKDEREHVFGLEAAIKAVAKLDEHHQVNTPGKYYWGDYWLSGVPADRLLEVSSINDLSHNEQRRLLRKGVRRKVVEYPYLTVKDQ